jgi:hypothetical protein
MTNLSADYFDKLTANAQAWAQYFEQEAQRNLTPEVRHSQALFFVFDEIMATLLDELRRAIETTEEYSYQPLRDNILEVFSNRSIVKTSLADDSIYFNAEGVAGDTGDLWDSIEYARQLIGVSTNTSKEQKAAFWRNFIYAPARLGEGNEGMIEEGSAMYQQVIELRLAGWRGLAPYWYWLEHGNEGSGLEFPSTGATNFLYKAQQKATALFKSALNRVDLETSNIIQEAAENYLQNPDTYTQFDVLGDFSFQGRQYLIYVTKTRLVGVALPSTVAGEQRGY